MKLQFEKKMSGSAPLDKLGSTPYWLIHVLHITKYIKKESPQERESSRKRVLTKVGVKFKVSTLKLKWCKMPFNLILYQKEI